MARGTCVSLLLLLLASCVGKPATPRPEPSITPSADLTFVVREAGRLPLRDLSGVEIIAIGKDGNASTLGRTFAGRLRISKDRLRRAEPQAIIFVLEGFHSGGIWLSGTEWRDYSIYRYDEYSVDLAPLVFY